MSNIDRIETGTVMDSLAAQGIELPKLQLRGNKMNPYTLPTSFYNESVTRYHRAADALVAINCLLNAYSHDITEWHEIIASYPELDKIKSEVRRLAYVYKTYGDAKGVSKPLNKLMAKFHRIYDDILRTFEVSLFVKAAWNSPERSGVFEGRHYLIATMAWGTNNTHMYVGFHIRGELQNCRYGTATDNGKLTMSEYKKFGRLCNRLGGGLK